MRRRLLKRTGASCMALAMLFMMSGGANIRAGEVSVEMPLTAQKRAALTASLDTMTSKNADITSRIGANGKLTLAVRAKDGYYFTDSPLARSDNGNVAIRRKSDNTVVIYNYDVSIYGDVADPYMISVKGETVVLTSSKLILNIDSLKNAATISEKNEGVTPLDNVILTLDADERAAFESVPHVVIDDEKRAMRSFADEKTMYIPSIMSIHKDTMIGVYDTVTSTEVEGMLDRIKVTGYINEGTTNYSTITLTNTAFHKLAKDSGISS